MPIIACGINHKTAPIDLREKVIFSSEKLGLYLQDLISGENIKEAVLLSTCNRSELYCHTDNTNTIYEWFCRQHAISNNELKSAWYCHQDQTAIEHMMQVACGLDSMVLGESQILGQMKDAFSEACAAGSIGPQFNRLFQQIFSVAKDVRTNTAIGACPVSIASSAVNLAKEVFQKPLSEAKILLIGAGDTIRLVMRHLQTQGVIKLIIANRNPENASLLAENFAAKSISFADLSNELIQSDIVISATGSPHPIVTKNMFTQVHKPLFIIDVAVPRDVEPSVKELPNVSLFSIDDLKNRIHHNLRGREHAALKAQQVIQEKSTEFMIWLASIEQVATTIRAYRKQIENLCDVELTKAIRQIGRGEEPIQVLTSFAHALTNKLLHNPSVQLRQAGFEGRFELLQLAQQLFSIPSSEIL